MGSNEKKQNRKLPVVLAACVLAFLVVGGVSFAKYLQAQIFRERTTQLEEVISLLFRPLKSARPGAARRAAFWSDAPSRK